MADRRERPYSEDHLSELSYRELAGPLLRDAGFELVEQSCLYLELWLTRLWHDDPTEDYLQTYGNRRENLWLMKRLFRARSVRAVAVSWADRGRSETMRLVLGGGRRQEAGGRGWWHA